MAKQKAYLGLDWIISVILAIFPFTNIVLGIITRIKRENWIGVIFNIIPFFWPVFWIVDLVTIIINKDLTILA